MAMIQIDEAHYCAIQSVLASAESFIAGFEGDESQDGIDELLKDLRAAQAGSDVAHE